MIDPNVIHDDYSKELMDVLVGLGYKQADIKKIVKNINQELSIENQMITNTKSTFLWH